MTVNAITISELRGLSNMLRGTSFLVEFPADFKDRSAQEEKLWRELTLLCHSLKIKEGADDTMEVTLGFHITEDAASIRTLLDMRVPFGMTASLLSTAGNVAYRHVLILDKGKVVPNVDWSGDVDRTTCAETLVVRYVATGRLFDFQGE